MVLFVARDEVGSTIEALPVHKHRAFDRYNFDITDVEKKCLPENIKPIAGQRPIPNVVHFAILAPVDIPFLVYLAIRAALISLNPDAVQLHHFPGINKASKYLRILLKDERVHLVSHDEQALRRKMSKSNHLAHLADAIRLEIMQTSGGIYLDTDVYALQSLSHLRHAQQEVVLGHEGANRAGLCPGVILARPQSSFIQRWIDSYATFRAGEWNEHSVLMPKKLALERPWEALTCSPHTFFYPTWTAKDVRWIHEPLAETEVEITKELLRHNNGSLFEGQLAYHAWNNAAWKKYLSRLDERTVKEENTRFNMLVRRFLDVENV
jgi:mannosyltransferase OCH1-like enzyme